MVPTPDDPHPGITLVWNTPGHILTLRVVSFILGNGRPHNGLAASLPEVE